MLDCYNGPLMRTHNLQLATKPFLAIRNGDKTIESRLYDGKRQLIQIGDEIVFTNRENTEDTLSVRVIGLLRYASFDDLFSHNDQTKFGGSSIDELLIQIREFYSTTDEQEYGVIGIEFVRK
jgi:ASC-1-like (ASCH) protein